MNLKINDRIKIRNIEHFNNFSMSLRFDAIASSFSFSFLFDPDNADHRELSCVSHFHEAIVEHDGELLITGYILSQTFQNKTTVDFTSFAGYSLTGVLEDCNISPSNYPLQSDGLTLTQIVDKLLVPFKLKYSIDSSVSSKMNKVIDTTTAESGQSIKDYLQKLCIQKNIIITHNEKGNLLFTSAKTNQKPVFNFNQNIPGIEYNLSFSGQGMHSEITVIKQASKKKGGDASQETIINPYVPIVFRPKVIVQTVGDDNDTQDTIQMILADELRNISLKISIDSWNLNDGIIKPNNIIQIKNKSLYLFEVSNWFIESVDYTGDNTKTTAVLNCVLPEVYNAQTFKNIFVDKHKNTGNY